MQSHLESEGYPIVLFGPAGSTYQIVEQTNPELLILDVRILGKEDWQVIDKIRWGPRG